MPVLRGCHQPAALTSPETVPVDSVLDPFGSHRPVRVCARGLSDVVRRHCQCVRVQSG